MPQVLQVSTVERRLFAPDVIPWAQIRLQSNLAELEKRYRFSHIRQILSAEGNLVRLVAQEGEFVCGDAARALEQLLVESNAVEFKVNVDSGQSGTFFEDFAHFLIQIDPNKAFSGAREYTRTYQTLVIAKLAVGFDALLSPALRTFVTERVPSKLRPPDAEVQINLDRLAWTVTYTTRRTDFIYRPKELIIQPRAGSDPSEMIYYTQSPTDFETHKELLGDFERLLAQAPR